MVEEKTKKPGTYSARVYDNRCLGASLSQTCLWFTASTPTSTNEAIRILHSELIEEDKRGFVATMEDIERPFLTTVRELDLIEDLMGKSSPCV